jgi:hypothetical protein
LSSNATRSDPNAPAIARPRLLFVPVSGPRGMGEYARCRVLADAARQRWPNSELHFLLSEQAPYAASHPYGATLFPSSPTLNDQAGRAAILRFAPDVAIFDNAGRRGQLAAARQAGAAVVFISSRSRPRAKAFQPRWLRHIDEHWIPYPAFATDPLTWWQRAVSRLFGRPRLRWFDTLLAPAEPIATGSSSALPDLPEPGRYVLFVPGGGSGHRQAADAPERFLAAAQRVAAAGYPVAVAGVAATNTSDDPIRLLGRVPPSARLVVCNGGDSLLQALACGRATVAAAIAGDQALRLARCARQGGVRAVALDAEALADAVLALLDDSAQLQRLENEARALGLRNGMDQALDALAALCTDRARRSARGD